MPERIYTSSESGNLEALEERRFSKEDDLQALIEKHPELLDGEQISPGNARRWLLISREKGIAPSSGEATRWSVDHLIVDQDAIPTLVEVKRGSSPELRRTIVGQLLEYAAHASETWTASELRSAFKKQSGDQDSDSGIKLADFLQKDGDSDADEFWDNVATNLAAKRLRLLFVADYIPDPLAQVVSFLNAQMPNIEVLAVEVKRFHGELSQTLVPRVIGRTPVVRRTSAATQKLNRDTFLESFASADAQNLAGRLLDVAEQPSCYVYYGTSGVSIRVICPIWRWHLSVAWLYPRQGTGWMRTKDFSFGGGGLQR